MKAGTPVMSQRSFLTLCLFCCTYIFCISSLANASDLDKIPTSQFKDAIQPIKIIETRQGGKLEAIVVIPRDMKRSQLRPTILNTLKKLKDRFDTASIELEFVPDDEHLAKSCVAVGAADYREGRGIDIRYGIPTVEQMQEYNSKIGKPEQHLFDKGSDINDNIPLAAPDRRTFETSKKIILLRKKIAKTDEPQCSLTLPLENIDPIAREMTKELKMPLKEIWRYFTFMETYYDAIGWDKETIKLR